MVYAWTGCSGMVGGVGWTTRGESNEVESRRSSWRRRRGLLRVECSRTSVPDGRVSRCESLVVVGSCQTQLATCQLRPSCSSTLDALHHDDPQSQIRRPLSDTTTTLSFVVQAKTGRVYQHDNKEATMNTRSLDCVLFLSTL